MNAKTIHDFPTCQHSARTAEGFLDKILARQELQAWAHQMLEWQGLRLIQEGGQPGDLKYLNKSQGITVSHSAVPDHREQDFVWPCYCQANGWKKRGALKVSDDAEKPSHEKAAHELSGMFPSSGKQKPWFKNHVQALY